jgi:hypothetical protein
VETVVKDRAGTVRYLCNFLLLHRSSNAGRGDGMPPRRNAPPPVSSPRSGRKLIAFGWYGGKFSHLEWLLPLLPGCHHYCEPFAGSGAVLLNRPPMAIETYNDLDGEVVNFFRALRDHKGELVERIGLTPFSREEFGTACKLDPELPPVERARRFYVRARQVRTGLAQTASLGRWANCKNTSRAGMSGVVSRWLGAVEMWIRGCGSRADAWGNARRLLGDLSWKRRPIPSGRRSKRSALSSSSGIGRGGRRASTSYRSAGR